MRSSNKSRSRNKNQNRRNNPSNVVNRVFDSSGPEGKVRGTPQQIIDKYQGLARDAQLSGDRVAHENFLQHSEHYARMLSEAQREMAERREQQEAQRQNQQQNQNQNQNQEPKAASNESGVSDEQPDISGSDAVDLFPAQSSDSNIVETPEAKAPQQRKPRPRKKPVAEDAPAEAAPASEDKPAATAGE